MFLKNRFAKIFSIMLVLSMLSSSCYAQNFISKRLEKRREKKEKEHPVNHMPKTLEEYQEQSKELKTKDLEIKEPKIPKSDKIKNDLEIELKIEKYNDPGGCRTIDLSKLKAAGYVHGLGVATASGDKLVYSAMYYDKVNKNVKSELYTIENKEHKSTYNFLKTANVALKNPKPILVSGVPEEAFAQQNVLTPVDWSSDGKKLAIKETIGNNRDGIWKTNLWVYDYGTGAATELLGVRREIINWWQVNRNLNLNDYLWDIKPLGWDGNNIVLTAYILRKDKQLFFLGEWTTDAKGENVKLVSISGQTKKVQSNGLVLKKEKKY